MAAGRSTKNTTRTSSGKPMEKKTTSRSRADNDDEDNSIVLQRRKEQLLREEKQRRRIHSIIITAIGILITIFVIVGLITNLTGGEGNLLTAVYSFLCGVFGFTVFFTGPAIIYIGVQIAIDKESSVIAKRLLLLLLSIILLGTAIQVIFIGSVGENTTGLFEAVTSLYNDGKMLRGGGVLCGLFASLLLLFGRIGGSVIIILIIFVFVMIISRKTLMEFFGFVGKPVKKAAGKAKEKHEQRKEEMEILREENRRRAADEEEKRKQKLAQLELATADNLHQPLAKKQKETLSAQKKDSDNFLSQINDYNGNEKSNRIDEGVTVGNDTLPEIVSENNINRGDKLPDIPTPIETTEPASPTSVIFGDELPPLPEYPPEAVNPVEAAVDSFLSEANSQQATQQKREEQFVEEITHNDVPETVTKGAELTPDEQYVLPPTTILDEIVINNSSEDIKKELEANSNIIVEALKSFGVQTKCIGVCRGPSVTRYELQPAQGVKISRITGLADDIALNLAASGIRIEAPIPGKPAVGIEVPNRKVDTVPFRTLIENDIIKNHNSKLAAVLGKDISGEIIIVDIADMPHLLIAGTTGSGKSVCVNSIIMSILFRSTPEEVRFIMIDPKAVEFMVYNGIPHLLIPVVTDPKKAAGALQWAVSEMLKRYNLFAEYNVRNIQGYNSLAAKNSEIKKLPQIVIFIDELADLIMASKNEVEDSICRLAQMARAAGMHLVIATQRPTVDVVTGLIKGNIPSRIALKVSQGVDSRVIMDEQGAEKLLGRGDMLLKTVAMPKPLRVQGCWISDKEVERVVNFIKQSFILEYDDEVMNEVERHAELVRSNDKKNDTSSSDSGDFDVADEKLEEAIRVVVEAGQASTSSLQRRLKLGYGRAARLIDIMEEMGIVGPSEGSKPRQVLMSREEYYQRQMNNSN